MIPEGQVQSGSRALKIALAVSVALNLFAVVGGTTALITRANVDQKVEDQRRPGRDGSVPQIVATLDPEVRDRVREGLRASALAARPDFEAARQARRAAVAATTATDGFDPAAVSALLETSRAAELRGRARLERDAVALLATLEPDDRKALGAILTRHGRGGGRGGEGGGERGKGGHGEHPRDQAPAAPKG
ncbi:periplasmic heavy metal sensor [Brevundimonas sp.]|uniref:periplasmic heavy metal sensor n=1 Tax=Brevundimonas sp. TaxID=1871086 RepID=UPI003BAA1115